MSICTDINKRWEEGVDHHPKSIALFKSLEKIDLAHGGDYFGWHSGGDGDNGEHLMYELDIHFETIDAENAAGIQWKPIDTAPKDNARPLILARINDKGCILEIDFDATWEFWQESWELPDICGYTWISANGIEEPTHWTYQ